MFDLLRDKAAATPQRPFVMTGSDVMTYADMATQAGRVAARLTADGVGRGSRIGLICNNRVAWLEIFFGAVAVGATVVPLSTWSTAAELEFLLNDAEVTTLFLLDSYGEQAFLENITQLQSKGRLADLERIIVIDDADRDSARSYAAFMAREAHDGPAPDCAAAPSDTLVILYTSGSSNRPKAVPLIHGAAIENAFNIGERQGLGPDDRVLVSIPLFWSYGAVNALPAILSHGATMVLQGQFEAGGALDLIEQRRCTALYALPAMTNALVAHPTFDPARTRSLRTGVTIGAPQDIIKAAEHLGAGEICNIYGATENYGNCCVTPHDWPLQRRANCQGPPLPGVTLRICDVETGEPVAHGTVGAIEVKGHLTDGYIGHSARFNRDVFAPDGFFKTGDLGALGDDGTLRFAGRSSEMIKRSGINVAPAEVEEVLQQHPDVALAGVTGIADPVRDELIVACVTPRAGAALDPDELIAHCRAQLSRYKVPDRLLITDALPLTVTGKLMRRELRTMAEDEAGPGTDRDND